jgi:hypothetical protein
MQTKKKERSFDGLRGLSLTDPKYCARCCSYTSSSVENIRRELARQVAFGGEFTVEVIIAVGGRTLVRRPGAPDCPAVLPHQLREVVGRGRVEDVVYADFAIPPRDSLFGPEREIRDADLGDDPELVDVFAIDVAWLPGKEGLVAAPHYVAGFEEGKRGAKTGIKGKRLTICCPSHRLAAVLAVFARLVSHVKAGAECNARYPLTRPKMALMKAVSVCGGGTALVSSDRGSSLTSTGLAKMPQEKKVKRRKKMDVMKVLQCMTVDRLCSASD